jgi:hypothetical protein
VLCAGGKQLFNKQSTTNKSGIPAWLAFQVYVFQHFNSQSSALLSLFLPIAEVDSEHGDDEELAGDSADDGASEATSARREDEDELEEQDHHQHREHEDGTPLLAVLQSVTCVLFWAKFVYMKPEEIHLMLENINRVCGACMHVQMSTRWMDVVLPWLS